MAAFADRKMKICNSDTGESFEVTVPDGLKMRIYEYNSNWLDSIPYLKEHARQGEPWAYEALGNCYRFGKGMDKSYANALFCYALAGKNIDQLAKDVYEKDSLDPIGLLYQLLGNMSKKDFTVAQEQLNVLAKNNEALAKIIGLVIENRDKKDAESLVLSHIDAQSSADELFFGFGCLGIMNLSKPEKELYKELPLLLASKIPMFYNQLGEKEWEKYNEESAKKPEVLVRIVDYLKKADEAGFLNSTGASILLSIYRDNDKYGFGPVDSVEMERMVKIAESLQPSIF